MFLQEEKIQIIFLFDGILLKIDVGFFILLSFILIDSFFISFAGQPTLGPSVGTYTIYPELVIYKAM